MKLLKVILISLYTSLLLTSCRFNEEDAATTQLLEMLNKRVQTGGLFEESSYGPQYWNTLSRGKWIKSQKFIAETHGTLQSYKIEKVQSKGKKKGFSSSGWVGFIISTSYTKGVEGQEQVNFYKPGRDQPFEVIAHTIKSPVIENFRKQSKPSL